MRGAILGDIVGSPYEFDRGDKTKNFEMFNEQCYFTDDTVMTVAVAEAMLDLLDESAAELAGGSDGAGSVDEPASETDGDKKPGKISKSDDEVRAALVRSMQKWGHRYPDAGYGVRFYMWLAAEDPQPYGSFGNGSAMRVSSVGWLFDTLEETRKYARLSAEVTHDHPEGIKGAESVAAAIFLGRTDHSKEEIRDYIISEFGYDLSRSCDEIRPDYYHVESCQETVPEAITAFLEGRDFEDVIRTAVSLGGDCDTLTCIAGSMAEAFYGMPEEMKTGCDHYLSADIIEVLDRFEKTIVAQ